MTKIQLNIHERLNKIIQDKKTNLALAADTTSSEELIAYAEDLGEHICILKTHIDIITNYKPSLTQELKKLAKEKNFLIFEDRKFADIGNTVKNQFIDGIYNISSWADLVTVHALPGPGILAALESECLLKNIGVLLLLEMSSKENLLTKEYRDSALKIAKQYSHIIPGVIAQKKQDITDYLVLTPGVKLKPDSDSLGQNYISLEKAILENGSDIIIVGRGITKSDNPIQMAIDYKEAAWRLLFSRDKGLLG